MNTSQNNSAQNTTQTTNEQTISTPVIVPGMTALEKSLIGKIKQCNKLIAEYQQAQGGAK